MEIIALLIIVIVAITLQGRIFKKWVLKKLEYKCEFGVNEAHEGEDIFLVETVYNRKLLPVPWLKAEIFSSRWLHFAEASSVVTQESRYVTSNFLLRGRQKITRRWNLKCLKRGIFKISRVTLVAGDLLGTVTDSLPVDVNTELVVYPEVISLEDMFVPANYMQGDTVVKRWIIDDPFLVSGTREYTPRDSMNRIDWRATAKTGNLMVKKNDFTSQFNYTVILNIQSLENEYYGTIYKELVELGIKAAATIIDKALRGGTPVRLATNGSTANGGGQAVFTSAASGAEHVRSLMRLLATLVLKSVRDFEDFLEGVSDGIDNTSVILITSYVNQSIVHTARLMKAKGNRVTIILLNVIETRDIPSDIDIYFLSESAMASTFYS
ncbi:MAG: DUF58 domain-containing protein [Clostridia bacterium]|nr:DUF58 domain-containing protein [Clostridia bacterium]